LEKLVFLYTGVTSSLVAKPILQGSKMLRELRLQALSPLQFSQQPSKLGAGDFWSGFAQKSVGKLPSEVILHNSITDHNVAEDETVLASQI
jgi:hypothetical protein